MQTKQQIIFNSPLETGLRVLSLLVDLHPEPADIQKLVFLDFLLVHSADVGGPVSLHPPTPHRSTELVLRREMLKEGVLLLMSRGLINRAFDDRGFFYIATEEAGAFIMLLSAPYTIGLRERSKWVTDQFGTSSIEELSHFFIENFDTWGGEFTLAFRSDD